MLNGWIGFSDLDPIYKITKWAYSITMVCCPWSVVHLSSRHLFTPSDKSTYEAGWPILMKFYLWHYWGGDFLFKWNTEPLDEMAPVRFAPVVFQFCSTLFSGSFLDSWKGGRANCTCTSFTSFLSDIGVWCPPLMLLIIVSWVSDHDLSIHFSNYWTFSNVENALNQLEIVFEAISNR